MFKLNEYYRGTLLIRLFNNSSIKFATLQQWPHKADIYHCLKSTWESQRKNAWRYNLTWPCCLISAPSWMFKAANKSKVTTLTFVYINYRNRLNWVHLVKSVFCVGVVWEDPRGHDITSGPDVHMIKAVWSDSQTQVKGWKCDFCIHGCLWSEQLRQEVDYKSWTTLFKDVNISHCASASWLPSVVKRWAAEWISCLHAVTCHRKGHGHGHMARIAV